MSFQKDRRLSVSTKVPKNFARTPPPAFLFPDQRFQRPEPEAFRSHRLAPGVGGGGDLVASVFRVKRFFLKKNLFLRGRFGGGLLGGGSGVSREDRFPCQPNLQNFFRRFRSRSFGDNEGLTEKFGASRRGRLRFDQERGKYAEPKPKSSRYLRLFSGPLVRAGAPSRRLGAARFRARRRYT